MDWSYEPIPDIDKSLAERLKGFPREPEMGIYLLRSAAALCLRAWLKIYHRLSVTGKENIPESKSFIIVANHTSHLDALSLVSVLPLRLRHKVFPAAASDYFFQSLPRAAGSAIFINALPFSRKTQIRQSISLCRNLLANPGNVLVIFPEGTRSQDGIMKRFKPGIGLLAAGLDIPMIPCAISGAHSALPKGRIFPLPSKISIKIGKPRTYAGLEASNENFDIIASELFSDIEKMLNPASR